MRSAVKAALLGLLHAISWRPNSGERHVLTRIRRGHLPPHATLADYEARICAVVSHPSCQLYLYTHLSSAYAVGVSDMDGEQWLVMVGFDGVMETAFRIDVTNYLSTLNYHHLGGMEDADNDPSTH